MVLLVTCWSTALPELGMTLDTRPMTHHGGGWLASELRTDSSCGYSHDGIYTLGGDVIKKVSS